MASVYVLYTGGTIGCEQTSSGLSPMPEPQFAALVASMPGLENGQVASYDISYTIDQFNVDGAATILDSSNMSPSDWVNIAIQIAANYDAYDGFVVLHGTDTMAFTASALSFLLPGLSKPVILTGSQIPLQFTLTDALPNLVGAIVLAGTQPDIPEVCLYFDSLLLRGNRSAKVNANQFAAFESPNFPPLATVGTVMTVNTDLILPMPGDDTSLSVAANLSSVQAQLSALAANVTTFSVVVLILYPGIQTSTVLQVVLGNTSPPVQGLVIMAFGEGNGPVENTAFMTALENANAAGVVLMDNTQVLAGSVEDAYATGLGAAGAVSAGDMTPEASLAKLVYLLGTGTSPADARTQMQEDFCGEITPAESSGTTTLAVM